VAEKLAASMSAGDNTDLGQQDPSLDGKACQVLSHAWEVLFAEESISARAVYFASDLEAPVSRWLASMHEEPPDVHGSATVLLLLRLKAAGAAARVCARLV
jgi:hypothetical protein